MDPKKKEIFNWREPCGNVYGNLVFVCGTNEQEAALLHEFIHDRIHPLEQSGALGMIIN